MHHDRPLVPRTVAAMLFATGAATAQLTPNENQLWHLDVPLVDGLAVAGDNLGWALASGDFDGDGDDDLAIGIPKRDFLFGVDDIGAVLVLYGTPHGLATADHQILTQGAGLTEEGDRFGEALAAGDFDCDGYDDLAVGAPYEDLGAMEEVLYAGAVSVFYGSDAGLGEPELFDQGVDGILGAVEFSDRFGLSLAAGDFDDDDCDDLAIGSPGDSVGGQPEAGLVHVLYGHMTGLQAAGSLRLRQGFDGLADNASSYDLFGWRLAAGDFDGDLFDDLVIGVPYEDLNIIDIVPMFFSDAGMVHVLYGGPSGLDAANSDAFDQSSSGILDYPDNDDLFGYALAAGDVDGDGKDDLAVGAPGEALTLFDGQIHLLFGSPGGISAAGNLVVNEESPGIFSGLAGNFFGEVLAMGSLDGDGPLEVVVGIPQQRLRRPDQPTLDDAGAAWTLDGSAGQILEPTQFVSHLMASDLAGIAAPAAADLLGWALAVGDFDGDGVGELAASLPNREVSGKASAGAVVVLTSRLFSNGFEEGDTAAWSTSSP